MILFLSLKGKRKRGRGRRGREVDGDRRGGTHLNMHLAKHLDLAIVKLANVFGVQILAHTQAHNHTHTHTTHTKHTPDTHMFTLKSKKAK